MAFLSIFDVVGPNMVGPSSSHTAGAVSISFIAKKIFNKNIKKVHFVLYGSFAKTYKGHGTDKALLGGSLGFVPDDLNIPNAFNVAKERGIEYSYEESDVEPKHPNTVDVCMTSKDGDEMVVRGVSVGGGKVKIVKIGERTVEFFGEYPTLIIDHKDKKGMLSFIISLLADANINIANLKLSREAKGETANTIIELDDEVSADILDKIRNNEYVTSATLIQI